MLNARLSQQIMDTSTLCDKKRDMEQLPVATLSVAEAHRRRVQNLVDYPQIAASYLHERFNIFLKCVLKKNKRLRVKEHWFQFEWQFRGSGHVHGFLWLDGAPDVPSLDLDD